MELLQSWQCSHQIEEDNDDEPFTNNAFTTIVSPTAEDSVSPIRSPVWDLSPRRHEGQEGDDDNDDNNDDDYAWYYKHPERIIWRPRRSRLIKSRRQKDKHQFTVFDLLLLNFSRDSWSASSHSETRDSMHSETWSLSSSSTRSTKGLGR